MDPTHQHAHIDPVCGMTVDPARAAGSSEYRGKTIYFCNPRCKQKFDANPEAYPWGGPPARREAAGPAAGGTAGEAAGPTISCSEALR